MWTFKDHENKDAFRSRDEWLLMTKDYRDPFGLPQVHVHDGISVIRDDLLVGGTKVRAAAHLLSQIDEDTVVYVVPRKGLAGVALIEAAKMHGKRVVFFMPSSRTASDIQAWCYERAADTHFHRIAAMPNLNRIAKQWAEDNGAFFVPLGLNHELGTAALVRTAYNMEQAGYAPEHMYVATSTGVLIRAMQIGMPNTTFTAVAVARNLQQGEKGPASFIPEKRPFLQDEAKEHQPPYPSVANYDAKVWKYAMPGSCIWNVGTDEGLTGDKSAIDSFRQWPKKGNQK